MYGRDAGFENGGVYGCRENRIVDKRKIAFITCVNDEKEYQEACWYLDRLIVPAGYEKDVIAVYGAGSMTEGYQAAMRDSDAKYKVYLHQDVFIINQHFIEDLLRIFSKDPGLGMLGCVGCEKLPLHAKAIEAWNVGKVHQNFIPKEAKGAGSADGPVRYVEAVDGLLMATQHDLDWRTDLFDRWDFYDISQCFEMLRAGYRVAVPFQDDPWCFHDNRYCNMDFYYEYCQRFIEEYQDRRDFQFVAPSEAERQFNALIEPSRQCLMDLVNRGNKEEVCRTFQEGQGAFLHLRDFEAFAKIAMAEKAHGAERFWTGDEAYTELNEKLRTIRLALIRAAYAGQGEAYLEETLSREYSIHAIEIVRRLYQL